MKVLCSCIIKVCLVKKCGRKIITKEGEHCTSTAHQQEASAHLLPTPMRVAYPYACRVSLRV